MKTAVKDNGAGLYLQAFAAGDAIKVFEVGRDYKTIKRVVARLRMLRGVNAKWCAQFAGEKVGVSASTKAELLSEVLEAVFDRCERGVV